MKEYQKNGINPNSEASVEIEISEPENENKEENEPDKKLSPYQKLKLKTEELENENQLLKDQYLRLLAEFDNFRKRRQYETLEAGVRTKREFLLDLLPILDDIERLFEHGEENRHGLFEGAKLIADKFRKTLYDKGLKPMDSNGKQFNPELHEALMTVEDPDKEEGTIIEVYEPGYLFDDQVLRYAKVVVSRRNKE